VPGLAVALRRPALRVDADLRLTSGEVRNATLTLPDAYSLLVLKARVRTVRDEDRDAQDLWRCLEIAAADGVAPDVIDGEDGIELRDLLRRELGPGGIALPTITQELQEESAARLRTRVRALLAEVLGIE
jgi:hypothetical protein